MLGHERHGGGLVDARDMDHQLAKRIARLEGGARGAVEHGFGPDPLERACGQEELHILRTELDPRGQNTAERSAWIIYDAESGTYEKTGA